MDNSGGFGGSRSEFIPGEGYDDSDIKYQRYGGCFVSVKKGFFYVFVSFATVIVCCALVFFYAPRWSDKKIELNDDNIDTSSLIDLLKAPPDLQQIKKDKQTEETQKKQRLIQPSHYKLFIQPYLDEDPKENFSFDGNVTITFTVDKPTKYIILNTEGLELVNPIMVTYEGLAKAERLFSASQVLEESNSTDVDTNSTIAETSSTNVEPLDEGVKIETVVAPDVATNTTNEAPKEEVKAEDDTKTVTTAPIEIVPPTEVPVETVPNTTTLPVAPPEPPNPVPVESSNTSSTISTVAPKLEPSPQPPINSTSSTTSAPSSSSTATPSIEVPTNLNLVKVHKVESKNGKSIIILEDRLIAGTNYTISVQFEGILHEESGLVKFGYKDDGKTMWNVILNGVDSGQNAFPCIEDLTQKAKYQINIARRTSKITLSNMPLKESIKHQSENGWIWDVYQESPSVALNTLSFMVYNLPSQKIPSESGALMSMWARKPVLEKANYAFETATKLLSFYNQFLGFHYPLTKLDLVAIAKLPKDSMHHFGLLSFSENVALVTVDSPNFEKLVMLKNMAFGFTKQWFGGLVTSKYKNESWINDGLTTYMQYLGINNIEPDWDKLDDFILMTQDALGADIDTTLVKGHLETDRETKIIFRKKACSIIRMLNNSLTDSVFIKGVRNYIDIWKYSTADEGAFWNILTKVGHENNVLPNDISIKDMMESWTNQDGYPVLEIERDYDKGTVRINQLPHLNEGSKTDSKWILPLTYITSKSSDVNTFSKHWIKDHTTSLENITSTTDKWILFNVHQTTPCRIKYDEKNWKALIEQLKDNHEAIPPINRAQLIDDAFHLTKHGMLDYETLINLTNYMKGKEKHYLPWATLLKNFEDIYTVVYKTAEFGDFQDYVLNLIKPLYTELGFETKDNDSYSTLSLRYLLVNWACKLNYKACRDKMYHKFQTWANFSNPDGAHELDYELRPTMYCVGVIERGKSAWNFLWDRFKHPTVSNNQKKALLTGMGCAKDTWMLLRYFQKTLNSSEISLQDSEQVWNNLPCDFASHEAFQFLREYWKNINDHYANHEYLMKSILSGMLSKLSTKTELNEMTRFFYSREELKSYGKFMAQAAKKIKSKLSWKDKYLHIFATSLQKFM